MRTSLKPEMGVLSMLVELSRDDNPRLYDDLIRFNKGPKRINRLRFLANEGVLLQQGLVLPRPSVPAESVLGRPGADGDQGDPALTNQLFGAPLPE